MHTINYLIEASLLFLIILINNVITKIPIYNVHVI